MILILTRSFPPELGGIQNLMWGLSVNLSKFHLVKVFANYQKGCEIIDKKVSFSIDRIKGPKLIIKYRKSYLVNNYLKNNKNVNCIISDHWKSLESIKSNKKKICLIHSKEINHPKGSRLNKRILNVLNSTDKVISNSNYTKNLAIELGVKSEKIIVIHPGTEPIKKIDSNFSKEADEIIGLKNPILITVSRLEKRKNHEKVIMALRNLKQFYPNILYICIGEGEEEEILKKLVRELSLEKQVIFLKNISQDLKNSLLSKSSLFVMPSIIHKNSVEGFGIVYIEAAQLGIASIGGKDGGASDAIKDNVTGLICDGNNLDEIFSKIDLILKNNYYKEFGFKAKEYAKEFTWDKIIKQYLKIIS
tara:strand:+ start:581 stop:1666 length:1086 start_codon:yes stop_codon:yes gene_type:complete